MTILAETEIIVKSVSGPNHVQVHTTSNSNSPITTMSQETRSYCTEDRVCSGMKQLLVLTLLLALGSSQFVFFGPRFGGQQLGRQPGDRRPVQSFTPAPQPTVSRTTVHKIYHKVNRLRSFLSSCHHVTMLCHHVHSETAEVSTEDVY